MRQQGIKTAHKSSVQQPAGDIETNKAIETPNAIFWFVNRT